MAKRAREMRQRERRMEKQVRKDARKDESARASSEGLTAEQRWPTDPE
jgi:hypothetical protein